MSSNVKYHVVLVDSVFLSLVSPVVALTSHDT